LEEMMKIQSCRFPSLRLPWIQIFLTEELLRLNGAKAEGIFRAGFLLRKNVILRLMRRYPLPGDIMLSREAI
uniref:SPATA6 domain-containing protein n=1 Tax=Hydatigena taeniaeformis TaxID=6205 RepID=A0A0R3WWF1_HYDTA